VFIYEYVLVNKKVLFVLPFLFSLYLTPLVSADDTCCVGQGGDNYCDTATSQLYCMNGQVSTQCTCHASPTATPTPVPTEIPTVSAPTCPINASFSQSESACTCNSGFVVSNNSCVTYGAFCQGTYGNNSLYDSGSNSCSCVSGYTWNTTGTSCVTMDALCNEKIGSNSYYNSSDNQCYCYQGYAIQNGQCQLMPTPVPPAIASPTTGVPAVVPTSVPIPTLAAFTKPVRVLITPTRTPVKKVLASYDYHKKVPGLNGYIAVKKKKPSGFFESLFTTIVQAFMKAFNI
jgi:hypothetical protein